MPSGTCTICGCTDHRPCFGAPGDGTIEAAFVQRLVPDHDLLAVGRTCMWLDSAQTLCSAHSAGELARHGFAVARHGNGLFEFGLGFGGDPC